MSRNREGEHPGYRFVHCPSSLKSQPKEAGVWRKIRIPFRIVRQIAHAFQQEGGIGGDEFWDDMYKKTAEFVPWWTLVDEQGQPLVQPSENPSILDELDDAELKWIFNEVLGGRAAPNA